ncbi:toxin VasX [Atopomonas hussainii]|uniref:toxin VasX n=1 Tax=Atopomonas hussainii TaxID=1429083 RepID=UPI0009003886|nr:toxin VasX [Atopomonas hussainii]
MSSTSKDKSLRLAQADQAAQQNFEQEDLSSPVASCPAKQAQVFLVPVRYALAETAAQHACFNPAVKTHSHPMALRRMRAGYLYLWHDQGPLRRFASADDGRLVEQALDDAHANISQGAISGFALDKQHDAWLFYSEFPLPPAAYQRLSDKASERKAHMRRISLRQVARHLEAEHCPPLSSAEHVIAELMPEIRDQALAHDYAKNGDSYRQGNRALGERMMQDPRPETINAYVHASQWLREREDAHGRHPSAGEHPPGEWSTVAWDVPATDAWLNQARGEAGLLHSVFASLEDNLGVLRDLNFEQATVSQKEQRWDQDNALKGIIAGFINSLISEDGAELSQQLSYRYREHDIQLTPEQGETLLHTQHELKPLLDEETRINHQRGRAYSHREADAALIKVHAQIEQVLLPVRSFIPAELFSQTQGVVMAYRADKARNMTTSKSGAQVTERVRLDRMNAWIKDIAEPHHAWLTARREVILRDTASVLPRHGKALWYVDYDSPDHCKYLSELSFNSLSELCSTDPGVQLASNLLRAPAPEQPFSLLASAFSPTLTDLADRANDVEAALTGANQAAVGHLLGSLVSQGKLTWLKSLGGPKGDGWSTAVSRLSAAFAALQTEHLASTNGVPANLIQRFPRPLQGMLLIMRHATDTFIKAGQASFTLSGSTGQRLWDWSQQAGQQLQKGLAPTVTTIKNLNTFGGVLPLAALLLHINNVHALSLRDQHRDHDDVRRNEHRAEYFKTGAALSAVIGAAWEATGQVETHILGFKAPIVTLFGFTTGALAAAGSIFDLAKLTAEMHKEGAYWTQDHWARLGHDSAVFSLMTAQAGLGGYATYMAITNQWTTQQAIKWFTLRMVPVSWVLLVVEGLYLAWNYFKDTELQAFLSQCCWGTEPRWNASPESQSQELQTLIDLLFKPRLVAHSSLVSRPIGHGGNHVHISSRTDRLELTLPGADPQRTQLYVRLVAFNNANSPTDCTTQWLSNLRSEWLPIHQGMGLRLTAKVPQQNDATYWQLQVLYHSPLALQVGTLSPQKLVVGGDKGLRYIIQGSTIIEHGSGDGSLLSDRFTAMPVSPAQLQPKDAT